MEKQSLQNPIQQLFTPAVHAQLKRLCTDWQISHISLFGSALRPDFRPESDIDLLLEFIPGQEPTYFQLVELQVQLETLFERQVDIVTHNGLLNSLNTQRAQAILNSSQVLTLDG
ncbi:MAG: nucleotidyltransferase domain-containing protein [Candidatus Sericytochromatia bacterium]|nr:nucleotidyltransferase domain-containing protein [Candidatus Sericytochromatia bacterium]